MPIIFDIKLIPHPSSYHPPSPSAHLAAIDCDTFLVAPFPEFNDAEDAAGSASVLRNVLFCQRVTDTVIDMLHATCCMPHGIRYTVYGIRYTVHAACYTQAANTVLKRAGRGLAGGDGH